MISTRKAVPGTSLLRLSSRAFGLTALPLAFVAMACGGSVAQAPVQPSEDAGVVADATPTPEPDASPTVDAAPIPYPAPHTPMPLIDNNGNRVMQNMHIVTVTWSADDPSMVSRLQKLDDTITQTPWWKSTTSEYCEKGGSPCIGPGTAGEHVVIKDPPPNDFTDSSQGGASTLQTWLKQQVATNPDFPDPTPDTLYAIYLPSGTSITLDNTQSCNGFGAYHNTTDLTGKKTSQALPTAYAIMPRCGGKESTTTVSASHEFTEAATDPDIGQQNLTFYMLNQTWAVAGGEVGDLCVDFLGGNDRWQESSFVVQRSWSNAAAKTGHDPCVPVPQGAVYFQAAPRKQKLVLKVVGDTAVLDIDAYSDAPTSDWKLSAFDYAQYQQNTTYLGFAFDTSNVNNGSHVQLTVTLKRAMPQYDIFAIISTGPNGVRHTWPVLVTPK